MRQLSRFWNGRMTRAKMKHRLSILAVLLMFAVSISRRTEAKRDVAEEYERTDLILAETVTDEEPLDGGRIYELPVPDIEQTFTEPLAVHNPYKPTMLSDAHHLKKEGVTLEAILNNGEVKSSLEEKPWIEHKVVEGERLADISRKYGILIATISLANGITKPNMLVPGQVLLIPRTEDLLDSVLEEQKRRLGKKPVAKQKAKPVKYKRYVVRPGDALWLIASANNLHIDSLYGTNILRTPDRLPPGFELRIPNQDGISLKVAAGQTVASLADQYNVPEKTIRITNNLGERTAIKAGQEIFIPGVSLTLKKRSNAESGRSQLAPSVSELIIAASKGDTEAVQSLIDAGVDVNARNKAGYTALMVAAKNGDSESVIALLKAGASVNIRQKDGMTALMWAATNPFSSECTELLLKAGADVNARNKNGWTTLIVASKYGGEGNIAALLRKGADVNAKEYRLGMTPLMVASLNGYPECVRLLLKAGADATAQDKSGHNSLWYLNYIKDIPTANKKIIEDLLWDAMMK